MIAIDLLKSIVEDLAEPDHLADHPLTTARFVDHYADRHPEAQSLARGKILGRALADLWRQRCLPPALNARMKREWNLFLTLEVGYFYPFRHERPFPGGLPQLGGLLLDRAHVALVIADGDEARAQTLLQGDYADLWETIAPADRKDALALSISTMASRRDAALRRLAKELEKLEMQREALLAALSERLAHCSPARSHQPSVLRSSTMPAGRLQPWQSRTPANNGDWGLPTGALRIALISSTASTQRT